MTNVGINITHICKKILFCTLIALITFIVTPLKDLKADNTTTLVFVTSEHCPFCKAWEQQVGHLYDQTPYGKNAPLRRIDISMIRIELPDLSPQVIGTPTFIVRESGKEIGRIRGYTDADMFYWQLSEYLSTPAN